MNYTRRTAWSCWPADGRSLPHEGKSAAGLEGLLRDADAVVPSQGAFGLRLLGPAARSAVPSLACQSSRRERSGSEVIPTCFQPLPLRRCAAERLESARAPTPASGR